MSIQKRNSETGFTLVESLVAGAVSLVIAVVMITVFNLFFDQVKEGTLRAKMQMDYDILSTQIGSITRNAMHVIQPGETPPDANHQFDDSASTNTICLRMSSGIDTVTYTITGSNTLQEQFVGSSAKNFKIGSRVVTLTPGSHFVLTPDRKTLRLRLGIQYLHNGKTDSLIVPGEQYICRKN
jgi:type II secretory pathway pseudopilin PulG